MLFMFSGKQEEKMSIFKWKADKPIYKKNPDFFRLTDKPPEPNG